MLPKHITDAIDAYHATDWKAVDPSGFGSLNAVAYIGEQTAKWYRKQIKPAVTVGEPATFCADHRHDPTSGSDL